MSTLAIEGHTTRGSEVIALLEMLGGKNDYHYVADHPSQYYYIREVGHISHDFINSRNGFQQFTLEEFEEKFPYKVGDKVNSPCKGCVKTITSMKWDSVLNTVSYKLDNKIYTNIDLLKVVNDLQPYKEQETMKNTRVIINDNGDKVSLVTLTSETTEIEIGDNYEIIQENGKYYAVKKKPKYPKTFIEVLNFWHPDRQIEDDYQRCYKKDLIEKFQDLLYARDSYWKIAGEEMGLGKPWQPDWKDNYQRKWSINFYQGEINFTNTTNVHNVLVFPTEEMRDAFYENFKDLIESVKELL